MVTTNQDLRVEGRTKLTIPHYGRNLTFLYPCYGPDEFANVGLEIERAGLKKPTMGETVSLVHAAFNSNDEYGKEIRGLIGRGDWSMLASFTGILYVPDKGAYIQDDPETREGMPCMEESKLIERLRDCDPLVRYVPFGFRTESQSASELAENPFVIGLVGKQGTQKLAEIANNLARDPFLCIFGTVEPEPFYEPIVRVPALFLEWNFGDRLNINADGRGYSRKGHAFGVLK